MANRGITGQLLTEIGKNSVEYYECIDIGVGSGYYITNAPRNLTIDTQEYTALGQLLDFGDISENITFEVPTLDVRLSSLPAYDDAGNSWTYRILNEAYQNKPVIISRAYIDASGTHIGSFEIYRGFIDTVTILFTPTGESAVNLSTTSHWVDFTKTNGRFTNSNSQHSIANLNPAFSYFTNDLGFDYSTKVQVDIEWK